MGDSVLTTSIMQASLSAAMFTINIIGNSLILLAVQYSKYFSHVTRHLIAHVAVEDILFGCNVMLRTIFSSGHLQWTIQNCIITTSVACGSSLGSGFGICLILVENYLTSRNLMAKGGIHMTLRKARACIICFWITAFILPLVIVYTTSQTQMIISNSICYYTLMMTTTLSLVILLFTAMLVLMPLIMLTVRKSLQNLFQGDDTAANLLKQRSMKKNAKLATLFIIIAVGFIVSWAPSMTFVTVRMACPSCVHLVYAKVSASFVQLNSCINFVVYVIKDKSFKNICMKLLKCKIRSNQIGHLNTIGS